MLRKMKKIHFKFRLGQNVAAIFNATLNLRCPKPHYRPQDPKLYNPKVDRAVENVHSIGAPHTLKKIENICDRKAPKAM